MVRPNLRVIQPNPPPRVSPAMPVVELIPVGSTSPKDWVSLSTSASVAPGSTHARFAARSTRTDLISERSIIRPTVTDRVARNVVATAANRDEQLFLMCQLDRFDHVGGAQAAHHEAGPPIDHGVPDTAGGVVTVLAGQSNAATQLAAQRCDRVLRDVFGRGVKRPDRNVCHLGLRWEMSPPLRKASYQFRHLVNVTRWLNVDRQCLRGNFARELLLPQADHQRQRPNPGEIRQALAALGRRQSPHRIVAGAHEGDKGRTQVKRALVKQTGIKYGAFFQIEKPQFGLVSRPKTSMISAIDVKKPSVAWPAAKVEIWPVEQLTANPRNARIHGPEQIEQIRASLREFGWTMPVLVRENGMLIAGHGRLEAAKLATPTAPRPASASNSPWGTGHL